MKNNIKTQIEECRKLIEVQLEWEASAQWKQRDYEHLSDLIYAKTGTRLSLSTLKRLWTGQFSNAPQSATLDALAQFAQFKSWNEFRSSATIAKSTLENEPTNKPKRNQSNLWSGLVVSLILGSVILLFLKNHSGNKSKQTTSVELKQEVNFSHKILAEGLPNTVIFSFDLSQIKEDSLFFQQSWDYKTRVQIPAKSRNFSSIYYYPGYHSAKLFAGKTQIAEQKVHIKTNGWQGLASSVANEAMPVYLKNPVHDGMLYAPLDEQPIQQFLTDNSEFNVRYYNISDFQDVTGDNFLLTAKIRNDIKHGGLTCQDVRFYISCESGMIIVPFCVPGCVANLNLLASNHYLAGQNNDLSALGINLSEWQKIFISSDTKKLHIKTPSGELSTTYNQSLGGIKGLIIEFHGSGAIDEISLGNVLDEKPKYKWMFD
jgi:hypothetical protein